MQRYNASAGVRIVGKKTLLQLITKFTLAIYWLGLNIICDVFSVEWKEGVLSRTEICT